MGTAHARVRPVPRDEPLWHDLLLAGRAARVPCHRRDASPDHGLRPDTFPCSWAARHRPCGLALLVLALRRLCVGGRADGRVRDWEVTDAPERDRCAGPDCVAA